MTAVVPPFDDVRHYASLYGRTPGRFAFTARTPEEAVEWQRVFRPVLRDAVGLSVMEADLAGHVPTAVRDRRDELDGYVRERWIVMTEPDVPLPVWILKPVAAAGRIPVVFTPHGHNAPDMYVGLAEDQRQRVSIDEGDRDVAVQAVREGYLAVAPTTRGFGDTRTAADREAGNLHSCRTALLHGLLVGRTAIGERVWDMCRLLDWILDREDADPSRVAITGNSGGGTVTLFTAACEERFAVAAPSCYFNTFAGSIGSIHHCACNYVPGILRLGEMADVAGLVAPRPFSAIAGEEDDIFPIRHAREGFDRLKAVYRVFGVPDRCELFVGRGGHRYYRDGAWPFLRRVFGAGG